MTPLIAFIIASIIGGANVGFVKFDVAQFPPIMLVALRSILAAAIVFPFVDKKELKKVNVNINLLVVGLLFTANWIFFAFGIQFTSAIMSQIIYIPTSLIVAVLGFALLKESLKKEEIFGLLLALVGMTVLYADSIKSKDIFTSGTPLGNFLVILGLLSWSLYIVFSRKISKIYRPLTILFFDFVIAAIASLVLLPVQLKLTSFDYAKVTIAGIIGILVLALFSSAGFFYFYQWLIKNTSAFTASLLIYPTAVISIFVGIIFFDEGLTYSLAFGAILAMAGVFFATTYRNVKNYIKNR